MHTYACWAAAHMQVRHGYQCAGSKIKSTMDMVFSPEAAANVGAAEELWYHSLVRWSLAALLHRYPPACTASLSSCLSSCLACFPFQLPFPAAYSAAFLACLSSWLFKVPYPAAFPAAFPASLSTFPIHLPYPASLSSFPIQLPTSCITLHVLT